VGKADFLTQFLQPYAVERSSNLAGKNLLSCFGLQQSLLEAVALIDELMNMCLFVATVDGFSIYEDTCKGYLFYEMLIRARVTFWSKILKWLRC